MQDLDGGVLAAVLGVGQGGLAGAGEAEHGGDELVPVRQGILLLPAVAAGVAVPVRDGPGQGQRALLVLAEVAHAQDGRAVGLGVEVAEALGVADVLLARGAGPLGIGEDVDVRLLAVPHGLGVLVHLHILGGQVLEVQHPVVEQVLLALGDEQVGLHHELRVQADVDLGMVHGLPAAVIDRVHHDLVESRGVHAGLPRDAPGGGITAGDGAVVEEEDLGVGIQAELLAPVDGHIRHHGAGRVLGQLIGLPEGVDLDDVVPIEGRLDDGAGLGEAHLAGADLAAGIVSLRRHFANLLSKNT